MFTLAEFRLAMEWANYSSLNPGATVEEFVVADDIRQCGKLSAENKKISLLKSIKDLKKISNFSELNSSLEDLEYIVFSPKISDLNEYYEKYFDPMKGSLCRELKLKSLETYLKTIYPEETIISVEGRFNHSIFSLLSELSKIKGEKPVYILYEFPGFKYQMLLIFQFKNDKFHLNVISSLGVSKYIEVPTYSDYLNGIIADFSQFFENSGLVYHDFILKRQGDQRNCSAIVADDMRIITDLINDGGDLFSYENDQFTFNNEFLKTYRTGMDHHLQLKDGSGKVKSNVEEKYLRPTSINDTTPVNAKATFLSLKILKHYVKNVAEFTPAYK